MTHAQLDHAPPLQDFLFWVNNKKEKGTRGPLTAVEHDFVPDVMIYEYFEDERRLRRLLRALGVDEHAVLAHQETIKLRYRKVFAILLYIGKGEFVLNFVQHDGLDDARLPFETEPSHFPRSTDGLFDKFHNAQWMFHAAAFHFRRIDMRLGKHSILPIVKKEAIKGAHGFSADLHKIVLHDAHHQLPASRDGNLSKQERSTFALKTYRTPRAEHFYEIESNAFKRLMYNSTHPQGLIGFYGSFIHGDTYNILLEYADRGTLEEYFQSVPQPWSSDSIADFWESFFGLTQALLLIHGELDRDPDSLQVIRGWHQDIKPDNILVLSGNTDSKYACQFRLGDLGQSHFKVTGSEGARASDRDSRGTRTYGAPECYRGDQFTHSIPLTVRPSVDIWSLGCISSEAAVWLVRGSDGLKEYRELRRESLSAIPDFHDSDCFHDGTVVLECVTRTLDELPLNLHRDDLVTDGILALIKDMLSAEDVRPNARQLRHRSQTCLNKRGSFMLSRGVSTHGSSLPMPGPQTPRSRQSTFPMTPGSHASNSFSTPPVRSPSLSNSHQAYSARPPNSPLGHNPRQRSRDESSSQPPSPISTFTPHRTHHHHHHHISQPGFSNPLKITTSENLAVVESNRGFQESPKDISPDDLRGLTSGSSGVPASLAREGSRKVTSAPAVPQTVPHTTSSDTPATPSDAPTYLSLISAIGWMNEQRKLFYKPWKRGPPDKRGDLMHALRERDHVLVVDDSKSMHKYRDDVAMVLEVLAYLVKDSDDDGIDLYCASSEKSITSTRVRKLKDALKAKQFNGQHDLSKIVGILLHRYLTSRREGTTHRWPGSKPPKQPKSMTCYILTNGEWPSEESIEKELRQFMPKVVESDFKKGDFGIQFIVFGNDPVNKAKLDRLDSNLGLKPDVVDAEPADGNVWKMLLGSISPYWDKVAEGDDSSIDEYSKLTMNGFTLPARPQPSHFQSS